LSEDRIVIVEVGPRDGLQNEPAIVPAPLKIELVHRLAAAGLRHIEVTAFVSPRWVPQMADSAEVMAACAASPPLSSSVLSALVPNIRGFEAARAAGCREVAVFASASETFSQRNINCSIAESLDRFAPVFDAARALGIRVRAYISCVIACPYEGPVPPGAVARLAVQLRTMGAAEISLGDTIGAGVPKSVHAMLAAVQQDLPASALAGHFHDTWGMAIANVQAALDCGIRTFDGAIGGLGGCPYAPGASGNVATEELVYLAQSMGLRSDLDLEALVGTALWIGSAVGRHETSRVAKAVTARRGG
jgi:hydroxymethylglutaryl-CoA lyase